MHCHDCFHNNVCGNSSPYNDVSMCKQFIERGTVLYGTAFDIVSKDLGLLRARVDQLNKELRSCTFDKQELERELTLLRIIKQTLEMQSGMKFDI